MQIEQFVVTLGPLRLTSFSLSSLLAVVVAGAVVMWSARHKGEEPVVVFDLLSWSLLLSVILGRLLYVLDPPPSVASLYSRAWYLAHPLDMQIGPLAVWSGGLDTAGILVGAVLGALLVLWRLHLDFWPWADICVPGLLVFLIITPWGNLLVGQMLGPTTYLPWGVGVAHVPSSSDALTLFHPTPAYLSLWALLILLGVGGVHKFDRLQLMPGDIFLGVTLFYSAGLFAADFLRVDVNRLLFGLSAMQVLAVAIVVWAVSVLLLRYRKNISSTGSAESVESNSR